MKIEKYLVLNKYLLHLFGVNEFRDLQEKLKDTQTDYDSDGRSYFVNVLRSLEGIKIKESDLLQYDENIKSYLEKINSHRHSLKLKYFQYLAVLFSEIVLDSLKNKKSEFIHDLNNFLRSYKKDQEITIIDDFVEEDLKKLAFWMATGSGKTLILHINYYQFLNYQLFYPDNILLITPNEGLSKQHFEELEKSGIPAKLYADSLSEKLSYENQVLVIEMTKFVEEKKGKGVTLAVDSFEGKNLVFVDEGHKGKSSEEQKWAKLRNQLSKNGFVFEYSATFGQILSEKEKEILKEYAKSIIFDYSYKYFYLDGYGKDFSILNLKETKLPSQEEFKEIMFVANLLSFYEQLKVYEENQSLAKNYNLEKPLWIFVGTTVSGKEQNSDIIQIVELFRKTITDEQWLRKTIEKILNYENESKIENYQDIFKEKFSFLKNNNFKTSDLNDLYKKIFGGKGSLSLYQIKNAEGEIGLKVGENDYFGVINIGKVSELGKILEQKSINLNQDSISSSLFDEIKKESSRINISIGAKKFIEGWDTWRVSSMGLINIGKSPGPQIIQLFGRGVRIKGKGMSLKRSGENLRMKILETLNIYGIKADYLTKFLEAINKEDLDLETIEIPIQFQHKKKWKELYILSKPKEKFEDEKILRLTIDDKIKFSLDLTARLLSFSTKKRGEGIEKEEIKAEEIKEDKFTQERIELLDWQSIFQEIINFKENKNYCNLIFELHDLKKVLLHCDYKIQSIAEIFEIKEEKDIKRLEEIAILLIKKYLSLFYEKNLRAFETAGMTYGKLEKQLPLFSSDTQKTYLIQINKREKDIIDKIKKIVKSIDQLMKDDDQILPRVYFEKSLYLPLLCQSKIIDKISPQGLVQSEYQFILKLREYLNDNKNKFSDFEIYLLRNHPLSGVGFQLSWSRFFPDFILWIKENNSQKIIFIDPKGLEHNKDLDNEKIQFVNYLKEIEKKLKENKIQLASFIISQTDYQELIKERKNPPSQDEYENNNVLFLSDKNCMKKFFLKIIK
ncbi:MAG: DEAD/DEAH box helicase family protein [Patescibacteria group bacterium]|nr:DEAD/DEAH box helicase family protein [Patescibacteria group bacterium]